MSPGQPFDFYWFISQSLDAPTWTEVELELRLASSGEPLWLRQGIPFPPPGEPSSRIEATIEGNIYVLRRVSITFPPPGYFKETAALDESAGRALYTGFGTKKLLALFTAGGFVSECPFYVEVIPESDLGIVSLHAPHVVSIGETFTVGVTADCHAYASMVVSGALTVSGQTGSPPTEIAMPPLAVRSDALSSEGVTTLAYTWRWVDKPTYHVRDYDIDHAINLALHSTWTDHYGNLYENVDAPRAMVHVLVGALKIHYAKMSEAAFWASVGFGVGGAIVAALLSISVFGGAVAAGVTAAEVIYFQAMAAHWASLADDPIEPDLRYWSTALLEVDRVAVPDSEFSGAFNLLQEIVNATTQFPTIYRRSLGAYLARSPNALRLQFDRLDKHCAQFAELVSKFSDQADWFIAVGSLAAVSPEQLVSGTAELRDAPADTCVGVFEEVGFTSEAARELRGLLDSDPTAPSKVGDLAGWLRRLTTSVADAASAMLLEAAQWRTILGAPESIVGSGGIRGGPSVGPPAD